MTDMDFEARLMASLEEDIAANRLILPSLPEVALQVRRIADQPDASLPEIAAVIARDPALSARLLKVVNSASMRSRQPVEDIKGAIQRLGLRLVRNLVSNLAIIQTFEQGDITTQRALRGVSEHSVEIAVLSHALAAEYTRLNPEEAMLAGLIHDIGKLPLLRRASELPEHQPHRVQGPCQQLHSRVGAMVLESWKFPPELIAVAREHEDIGRASGTQPDLVDVVIVANLQAHRGLAANPYVQWEWRCVPAVKKLGLEASNDPVPAARYQRAREMIGG